MKTLKNLAAFVVAATLLVACGDNATVTPTNDPLAGVTLPTCQTVQNPLTDNLWLARAIRHLDSTKIASVKRKIYSGQYKGKTLYFFEFFPENNSTLPGSADAYDCNGGWLLLYCKEYSSSTSNSNANLYEVCKDDKYMPLKKQTINLTLIYEEK
jgi:hypothetical protein